MTVLINTQKSCLSTFLLFSRFVGFWEVNILACDYNKIITEDEIWWSYRRVSSSAIDLEESGGGGDSPIKTITDAWGSRNRNPLYLEEVYLGHRKWRKGSEMTWGKGAQEGVTVQRTEGETPATLPGGGASQDPLTIFPPAQTSGPRILPLILS